MGFPLTPGVS